MHIPYGSFSFFIKAAGVDKALFIVWFKPNKKKKLYPFENAFVLSPHIDKLFSDLMAQTLKYEIKVERHEQNKTKASWT